MKMFLFRCLFLNMQPVHSQSIVVVYSTALCFSTSSSTKYMPSNSKLIVPKETNNGSSDVKWNVSIPLVQYIIIHIGLYIPDKYACTQIWLYPYRQSMEMFYFCNFYRYWTRSVLPGGRTDTECGMGSFILKVAPFWGLWMKIQQMLTGPWSLWSSCRCKRGVASHWGIRDQSCCSHLVLSLWV